MAGVCPVKHLKVKLVEKVTGSRGGGEREERRWAESNQSFVK